LDYSISVSVSQNLIGSLNPQKKTINFNVQRSTPFNSANTSISFETTLLNEGKGFDPSSGIFTVPVNGIYHFQFITANDYDVLYLDVLLQVNGVTAAHAYGSTTKASSNDVVSLTASLRLAANDKVTVLNHREGVLFDDQYHFTHFIGWLVEEDLM